MGGDIEQSDADVLEWVDNYINAHRIAEENHEHMRKWLTKIPIIHLLRQIQIDYIDGMVEIGAVPSHNLIHDLIKLAIDDLDPRYLLRLYTAATPFFRQLNKDLAKRGKCMKPTSSRLIYQIIIF